MTAPDLHQRLADAIRDAVHTCTEDCLDTTTDCTDLPILASTLGTNAEVLAVDAGPEAIAEVCAGAVQRELDAAQNALISMAERAASLRQRAEAAEEEVAQLRPLAARMTELDQQIGGQP